MLREWILAAAILALPAYALAQVQTGIQGGAQGSVQSGCVQCGSVQSGSVQSSGVQSGCVQCGCVQCGGVQSGGQSQSACQRPAEPVARLV